MMTINDLSGSYYNFLWSSDYSMIIAAPNDDVGVGFKNTAQYYSFIAKIMVFDGYGNYIKVTPDISTFNFFLFDFDFT